MPATSKAQQRVMAIAEHDPDKLYARNKGLLKMSHDQLHDFASTPRKSLPNSLSQFSERTKSKSKLSEVIRG